MQTTQVPYGHPRQTLARIRKRDEVRALSIPPSLGSLDTWRLPML